jgi:hemolysin-activating ACP:hemolysin acyltransferase
MTPANTDFKTAVVDGIFLLSHSKYHRYYSISEFISYIVYPVLHGKIKIFYEDDKPVGLVTWCFLPADKAQAFLDEEYVLQEEDYIATDGEQLWGIEFIAPFGHARTIMRAMNNEHSEVYGRGREVFWRRFKTHNSMHKGVFKWVEAAAVQRQK